MKKRITSLHPRPVLPEPIAAQLYRAIFNVYIGYGEYQSKTVNSANPSELGHMYDGHDSYYLFVLRDNGRWYMDEYKNALYLNESRSVARLDGRYMFIDKNHANFFIAKHGGFINK